MGIETRRKNVMTEFSNVYSTYSTSEMFGYRSSRRVSNQIISRSATIYDFRCINIVFLFVVILKFKKLEKDKKVKFFLLVVTK